jgi:transposase-like protein
MGKKHKPEEIIGKLREAEIVRAQGGTVADTCRRIGVTEQSYYRWREGVWRAEDERGTPDEGVGA